MGASWWIGSFDFRVGPTSVGPKKNLSQGLGRLKSAPPDANRGFDPPNAQHEPAPARMPPARCNSLSAGIERILTESFSDSCFLFAMEEGVG
jgi:hypothetical protein